MSGGGKSSTSTSSVSIPPEVLARYNAVNTRAEVTGQIPFQPYTGEFVAPLSQTQQAGIANINQAAGMAQPYYQAAGSAITGGAAQAQPYYQAATNQVYGGLAAAQPLQQASVANQLAGQAAGTQALQGAFGASQPVMQGALTGLSNIPVQSLPLQQQALLGISQAQASADPYQQASYGSLMQAGTQAQPYTREASQALSRGEFAAQPMQQMAGQGISAAQAAGAPYQQLATQFGLAGAQRIDPNALNVQRYMSPFLESVAQPTLKALQQQQQQEQQKILGDQIRSGAFGGDRGKIAQAVLAQQQGLATGQAMGNIYQQGYGQALSTAQQQQQTALAAEQANRAAQQAAAQQMLGIGQQGFGQEMAAAQQRAALGQQLFGQGVAGAQQRAALGQQVFGQGAQTAQQQAALAQQLYGQGLAGAQAQQGVAQQMINQGLGIAGQQAGIGQNLFGQGAQAAQQLYGMGAGTAQQQAALAQQQYAQQMGAAQQLQGLGQGLFGIGSGVSQGLTGIGGAAQQAALQGGQAQLGAGTVEQQTQQALNQALYNQFLQQQGYPYQVAQFLGNIAMGTGALSGSTTTTTQPSSFFSDKRLKDDIEPIGKTYDGQEIVRYRYKGEPATRIGLVAQDVEKKHPEAVGLAGGFKTVDYDKATDDAAARAPKAYGGGLNPWTDASMGGGVFREDAGKAYAAGGSPGDDILAQINALVNAHQGMFPYGKSGMYGSGMGKAGPYGSTLMQPSNRQLMRADPVRQAPQYDVRQAMRDVKDIQEMPRAVSQTYYGLKRGLMGAPESTSQVTNQGGQTTTQTTPASGGLFGRGGEFQWEGSWLQQLADAAGMANGGGVRQGLAAGGLPYSNAEDEYVPEDISAPIKPAGLQPAKPPPPGRTTGDDLMTMAKLAAMFAGGFASGGLVPRQGYRAGGDPQENVNVPEGYLDFVGQREGGNRSDATNPLFPPERGGPVGRHQFTRDTWLELARNDPRFEGKNEQEILAARTDPVVSSLYALRYGQQNAPILQRAGFDPTPQNLYLAHAQGPAGATALLQNPDRNVVDVLTDVYGSRDRAMAVVNSNRGNPDMTASQFAANLTGARPQATGVAPPNAQGAGTAPPSRQEEQKEGPDWLQRNERWLVPLVTGLGTMASSPSRYLGSAVLQGLMGAGQAYQGQLTAEGQRARTAEETKKIAEEAQLNRERQGFTQAQTQSVLAGVAAGAESPDRRTVRIFRNGRYTLIPREEFYNNPGEYQLYLAPYTAEERERLRAAPAREPLPAATQREPSTTAQPGAPAASGEAAPDGARPDAAPVPPGTVPTTRSTDPVALVTALPEETRNMADQEIRAARTLSTTDLRSAAAAIPSSQDVFTTARTRAASAAGSLADRINLAKEFMALPDEGIGSLGRANVFLTPMLSWANSTLRLFNVQDANGQLVQLNPRQLAGLEAIDKETIQTALNRQGQSGSRAFAELNAILSATPNTQMTRETVQKILAGNFMEEQRAVDLDNFANLWRSYVMRGREGAVGVSPDELRLTGPQVEREFNRLYNAQYNKEKAGIEKILDSTFRGRPLIDLIIESRGQPSQGFIDYMNQNFADQGGARLLRYFYGR